jgi:hypothetical protein
LTAAGMTSGRPAHQRNRLGAQAPRYAFILNAHTDSRFTRCTRCETRTNLRKFPLVIHVEGFGLVLLGKTCRLWLRCDTLVVQKAELDDLLRTVASVQEPEYVVLGTIDRYVYRRGLSGGASLDDVNEHMADFKSYWRVDVRPSGWSPKDGQAG